MGVAFRSGGTATFFRERRDQVANSHVGPNTLAPGVTAGAIIVQDIVDPPCGGGGYSCRDPEGHLWWFGNYDPWQHEDWTIAMTLAQARAAALALPEAAEVPHFRSTSFRVRGKMFATALPEGTFLNIFVGEEDLERALALEPDWIEPLHWGGRVWGVRIALPRAKPAFVARLLRQAWARKAPKALRDALP